MAGCDKADRQRKSAGNIAYKASNRREINKKRKQARAAKFEAKKAAQWSAQPLKNVKRGTARALRRRDKQLAYTGAV